MFEAGLAIIAVCLPTLNTHLKKVNAMAMIRSVRSMVSISSLRSGHSRSNNDHTVDRASSEENTAIYPSLKLARSSVSVKQTQEDGTKFVTMHDMPERQVV
jgi:hypothetical protein